MEKIMKKYRRIMMVTMMLLAVTGVFMLSDKASAKTLPKDNKRIVFQGSIKKVSHKGLLKMQGLKKSPNPTDYEYYKNTKFYIIKLKPAKKMKLQSVDGMSKRKVKLVNVTYVAGLDKYIGKNCIFSISGKDTWWPSDTSLPLGEPSTKNLHIYQKSSHSWKKMKAKTIVY